MSASPVPLLLAVRLVGLRLLVCSLAALGVAPRADAQDSTRTAVFVEIGDAGPLYVVGAERQIGPSPGTFVRAGLTVLTVFVADGGMIVSVPVSVGHVVRPGGGRIGVEGTVGVYGAYSITGTQLSGPPEREVGGALTAGAGVRWDARRGRLGVRYGGQLHLSRYGLSRPLMGLAVSVRLGR